MKASNSDYNNRKCDTVAFIYRAGYLYKTAAGMAALVLEEIIEH